MGTATAASALPHKAEPQFSTAPPQTTSTQDQAAAPVTSVPVDGDPQGRTTAPEADENLENHGKTQTPAVTDDKIEPGAPASQATAEAAARITDESSAVDTTAVPTPSVPLAVAPSPAAAAHTDHGTNTTAYASAVHPVSVKPPVDTDTVMNSPGAGADQLQQQTDADGQKELSATQQHVAPHTAGGAAALLNSLVEEDNVSWREVMWQACNVAAEQHTEAQFTADHAFGTPLQLCILLDDLAYIVLVM